MTIAIDYYLSLNSPWTYLGSARFTEIVRRHGALVRVKPVDYGRIFAVSGGLPLAKRPPQRQKYRLVELARWRDHLGVRLNLRPRFFPAAEAQAARLVIACRQAGGDALALAHAILRAQWAEERDIADAATLAAIAMELGHDAAALQRAAAGEEVAAAYAADTDEAIARDVFGAPSYVVAGEIFWGQDRLDFLDRRLAAGG
jgi:2-hydroxychromene-2-carboxylate isomerase